MPPLQVTSRIVAIRTVAKRGLHNIHVAGGEVLVDGVAATSMNAFVGPGLAQALLAVARVLYAVGGDKIAGVLTSLWLAIHGNDALAGITQAAKLVGSVCL